MNATPLHVLVVDDDAAIREMCCRMLSLLGHKGENAGDGVDALSRIRKIRYDVVLSDMRMPLTSGVDLLVAVRNESPDTEFVMMTGFGTIEDAVNAMRLGATDFLLKPIQLKQIAGVLHRVSVKIEARKENSLLREVNEKLKALNEAKSKFMALTSHEFRTPLFVLSGNLQRLRKSIESRNREEHVKMVERASGACSDLIRLVERISVLSALEVGNSAPERDWYSVAGLLQSAAKRATAWAERRGQQVTLRPVPASAELSCDADMMGRALDEVLSNAVKFTPDAGRIEISASSRDEEIEIRVRDNGIGIPETEREKIFQPFIELADTRFHSSSLYNFNGGGLGIGLATTRRIAEAHGGSVTAEPADGGGTVVIFRIPGRHSTVATWPPPTEESASPFASA